MPCSPSAPSFGHRSRGKVLVLSISLARGAISFAENALTVSRIASAVSPRSKLKSRWAFAIIFSLSGSSNADISRNLVQVRQHIVTKHVVGAIRRGNDALADQIAQRFRRAAAERAV